ncbi:MAG: DUF4402 domain-containing protein [Bacteroidales bacterium]|jgi:hypothetical protein
MNSLIQKGFLGRLLLPLMIWMGILLPGTKAGAQQMPPRPLTISKVADMNFGTFCCGTTGNTVILHTNGTRDKTGNIILLSSALVSAARFEVDAVYSTMLHILFGPVVQMSANGGIMNLTLDSSDPISPFTTSWANSTVYIGGTLTVATATLPAGNYSCTFEIMFIQE